MPEDIVIVGIGMITPLGLNADQTAASIYSGMSAFEESPFEDRALQPLILGFLPDETLMELGPGHDNQVCMTSRESRMIRLSRPAIEEALAPLDEIDSKASLFLGLPQHLNDCPINSYAMSAWLAKIAPEKLTTQNGAILDLGRAGGMAAIYRAVGSLQQGTISLALAGGVDSYFEKSILEILEKESRLNTQDNMDGFVPGEGAAFLLLATAAHAKSHRMEILGRILASASGDETGHLYSEKPYRGEGLAGTITDLFSSTNGSMGKIPTVFSSMNGESHFAKEWGVAYLRNQRKIESDFKIEHPADCIGDSGAACGPIMAGLALTALREGYLAGPVLVYASSDSSCRAACIVSGA